MNNGLGRCGEESSFTIAVLRSLCIPARQCYIPRWAHCDSNHAWVEAWADEIWYYFGACEPEPKLNMGWFSSPAKRPMLINTRIPGKYVNTKKVTIRVIDQNKNPVKNANVHFQIYNMAEFYPIAKLITDEKGEVTLITGYGDLFIHVFKEQIWAQRKMDKDQTYIEVIINEQTPKTILEIDMVPPSEYNTLPASLTEQEIQRNNEMLKYEDQLRVEYEKTFFQREEAVNLANELKVDPNRVWHVLQKARGNSHQIAAFLKQYGIIYGNLTLQMLECLNSKDLTDTASDTLIDHLPYSIESKDKYEKKIYVKYIMCLLQLLDHFSAVNELLQVSF